MTTTETTEGTWPRHPDGRNKRVGEMTAEERSAVLAAAADRFAHRRKVSGLSALRVGTVAGRAF